MRLIEDLFNLIAPHECLGCQTEGSLLCTACQASLQAVRSRCYVCHRWSDDFRTCKSCRKRTPLYSVAAITQYEGTAKELVRRLKFVRARAGAETIAEILAGACPTDKEVIVTHVPTASKRVRERGYDQAALIAKAVARRLNQPYASLLLRQGDTRQVGQRREIRKTQMLGVFRPHKITHVQGKHVLLIDDVLTTGATCEAAARVLRKAGAKRVSAAVFAVA